jgi:hypothetical protein
MKLKKAVPFLNGQDISPMEGNYLRTGSVEGFTMQKNTVDPYEIEYRFRTLS